MKKLRYLLPLLPILLTTFFACAQKDAPVMAEQSAETWEPAYVGSDTSVLFLPDAYAVYWKYSWQPEPGKGFVIRGKFPEARYFSYNVYDDAKKATLGSYVDFQIKPDENSKDTYTIYILPEGETLNAKNEVHFPTDLVSVSVFLRHYVPEKGIYGNVPLPAITAYQNGKESPASPSKAKENVRKNLVGGMAYNKILKPVFELFTNKDTIYSYRVDAAGTYPNYDNFYLTMPVIRSNNDVLLVRFRPPNYATEQGDNSQEVRYHSLNQGNILTYNLDGIKDVDMTINPDGYVYTLIGDDKEANREKAKQLGVNFMPWKVKERMVLIQRHMLPNPTFEGGIDKVPVLDLTKSQYAQRGTNFIKDYASVAIMMDEEKYLALKAIPVFPHKM